MVVEGINCTLNHKSNSFLTLMKTTTMHLASITPDRTGPHVPTGGDRRAAIHFGMHLARAYPSDGSYEEKNSGSRPRDSE